MQQEIEVLIIDDEEIWREGIAANLHDFGYTISGKASSYDEALYMLQHVSYDIVLVDIHLKDETSGLRLGKLIHEKFRKPFIYITAQYSIQHMGSIIESRPSAYLVKPVNPFSLVFTIQTAINNFNTDTSITLGKDAPDETQFFFVKIGDRYKKINWADIVYLRSDKNYTYIFNASDKIEYSIRSTLTKTIQYIIPRHIQNKFIQINRAEVIQLSFVQELNGEEIRTAFKTLYVTDNYNKELRKRVMFF
jgi:DNA-binding LytR/AlgR family response regulator